jgi:hypothetical protein
MENFDLKKFLVENKLTTNSRMLNESDEQINRVRNWKQFLNEDNDIKQANPGETIEVQADLPIKGEVYLTDSDIAYHGGLIDNIDDYLSKTALYITKSKGSAVSWNLKGHLFTRLYEVKIKKGSKFINSSPGGRDASENRLNDEKEALLPLGIVGMADNELRHSSEGNAMSEGLILHKSAIESFRVVPFREILNDENLRNQNVKNVSDSSLLTFELDTIVTIEKFYNSICAKVFKKKYPDITQKIKSGEGELADMMYQTFGLYPLDDKNSHKIIIKYIYKNKNIQSEIDNIVESMSNEELKRFILSK